MSSRFAARDYDDRPLSSSRSLLDLSPSSRSALGHPTTTIPTDAQDDYDGERSTIRINTDLTTPAQGISQVPWTTGKLPRYVRSSHARSTSTSAPVTAVETCPRERPGVSALHHLDLDSGRPPTTNNLRPQDRADLVRKSRKLTQLFGQTPSPQSVTLPSSLPPTTSEPPLSRTAAAAGQRHSPRPIWGSPRSSMRSADSVDATVHDNSVLPSPIDALSISELSLAGTAEGDAVDRRTAGAVVITDPYDDDAGQPIPFFSPRPYPSSPRLSSLDPADSMLHRRTPEEVRRRRREKIAKLHRFLGSRVPTSLVLGFSASHDTLPALDPTIDNIRTSRHNRRRSSSAAETRTNWFGPDDRMKEELDEREKAINVRRAIKMEKMFGVQPPQTLYHTRHSPRPIEDDDRVHSEREAVLLPVANRNVVQGSYLSKDGKQSRHWASSHSHSHSESMPLLDPMAGGSSSSMRASAVYMHYRYSLNSLSDIIDRDDRESLAELHSILTNDQSSSDGSTPVPRDDNHDDDDDDDDDDAKTVRSERRRSLPARSSTVSLASQFSLATTPSPERTSFQARRRRAAKLTHFFGVDYRDLIGDILESIERYVEEESHRGALHPEEIQDLVVKLRKLRTKRTTVI